MLTDVVASSTRALRGELGGGEVVVIHGEVLGWDFFFPQPRGWEYRKRTLTS